MPRVSLIRRPLPILLALSTILLVTWSLAVPIFEAPDEPHHWDYARYVHDHHRLPRYTPGLVEGNQPPLYYWLIAPISTNTDLPPSRAWLDAGGVVRLACPPRFYRDCLSDLRKYWPIRWARLATVLLSTITVLFTYLAAREATGNQYGGLLAGGLAAFLPQFTFRGVNVSNDAMVATTSGVCTYLIIRLIRRGFSLRMAYLASFMVALAFVSKISAMIFIPVLALVLTSLPGSWRDRLKRLQVLLLILALVLPWLLRNQRLYGDPLANKSMLVVAAMLVDKKPISSPYFITTFPKVLCKSFIGVFGWMNVYLPSWIYYLFACLALLSLVGCLYGFVRHKLDRRVLFALGTLALLALAATAHLNLTFDQPQGRYAFPALTAVTVLGAIGLGELPAWRPHYAYFVLTLLIAINLYALFGVEWRAYWTSQHTSGFTIHDVDILPDLMSGPAGPLLAGERFGQTFSARGANLSAVEVVLATYNKRIPSGYIELHLRASPENSEDIANAVFPASSIIDNKFVRLSFPPLSDSKDKSYYVFVDRHDIPSEYLVTVYVSKTDIYPGGQFFVNDKPMPGDMLFRALDNIGGPACAKCD